MLTPSEQRLTDRLRKELAALSRVPALRLDVLSGPGAAPGSVAPEKWEQVLLDELSTAKSPWDRRFRLSWPRPRSGAYPAAGLLPGVFKRSRNRSIHKC
jgi:hypothetical protein